MKTRGFTLTELTIVLGIAGIILGGLWGIAVSASNVAKQDSLAQLIATVAFNMRGVYSGRAAVETTDAGSLMPLAVSRNVFPSSVLKSVDGKTVAISPFGERTNPSSSVYKSIYVCGWSVAEIESSKCEFGAAPAANVPLFAIEALLARGAPCVNAIVRNSNPATLPGLTAVYSNGSVLASLPATPAQAVTACSADVNYVDFVFRTAP